MNETLINDQLSWNKFFDESRKRKIYPPKTLELFNRLVAHTNNFFVIAAIGAFAPGYLMIVTKEFISIGNNCVIGAGEILKSNIKSNQVINN